MTIWDQYCSLLFVCSKCLYHWRTQEITDIATALSCCRLIQLACHSHCQSATGPVALACGTVACDRGRHFSHSLDYLNTSSTPSWMRRSRGEPTPASGGMTPLVRSLMPWWACSNFRKPWEAVHNSVHMLLGPPPGTSQKRSAPVTSSGGEKADALAASQALPGSSSIARLQRTRRACEWTFSRRQRCCTSGKWLCVMRRQSLPALRQNFEVFSVTSDS